MAAQTISPFFRSPFTDITAGLISHQVPGSRCRDRELEVIECLEMYGLDNGIKKCKCIIEDFKECQTMNKQLSRFVALRKERERQIAQGKLTGDRKYHSPCVDSY